MNASMTMNACFLFVGKLCPPRSSSRACNSLLACEWKSVEYGVWFGRVLCLVLWHTNASCSPCVNVRSRYGSTTLIAKPLDERMEAFPKANTVLQLESSLTT